MGGVAGMGLGPAMANGVISCPDGPWFLHPKGIRPRETRHRMGEIGRHSEPIM